MQNVAHTARVVADTQSQIIAWMRRLLAEAGFGDLAVAVSPRPGAESAMVSINPFRVQVLGRSGDARQGVPLLTSLKMRSREAPNGVPVAWSEFAAVMSEELDRRFPMVEERGPAARILPPPVADLPAPLRDWYASQGGSNWMVPNGDAMHALPPTLAWLHPMLLKLQYVVTIENGAERTVPALSILDLALHWDNSFDVPLPPIPLPPQLASYVVALADAASQEVGAALRARFQALSGEYISRVSLAPLTELTAQEMGQVLTVGSRGLPASLQFGLQLALGSDLYFGPTASPSLVPMIPRRA